MVLVINSIEVYINQNQVDYINNLIRKEDLIDIDLYGNQYESINDLIRNAGLYDSSKYDPKEKNIVQLSSEVVAWLIGILMKNFQINCSNFLEEIMLIVTKVDFCSGTEGQFSSGDVKLAFQLHSNFKYETMIERYLICLLLFHYNKNNIEYYYQIANFGIEKYLHNYPFEINDGYDSFDIIEFEEHRDKYENDAIFRYVFELPHVDLFAKLFIRLLEYHQRYECPFEYDDNDYDEILLKVIYSQFFESKLSFDEIYPLIHYRIEQKGDDGRILEKLEPFLDREYWYNAEGENWGPLNEYEMDELSVLVDIFIPVLNTGLIARLLAVSDDLTESGWSVLFIKYSRGEYHLSRAMKNNHYKVVVCSEIDEDEIIERQGIYLTYHPNVSIEDIEQLIQALKKNKLIVKWDGNKDHKIFVQFNWNEYNGFVLNDMNPKIR